MAYSQYDARVKPKLLLIESWARNGLTDDQIAKNLGVSKTTFYKYIKEHSELSELLKKGKEVVDVQVENALLKRALGYSYNEDKYIPVPMSSEEYSEKLSEYMNTYKFEHPDATYEELLVIKNAFPKEKMVLAERKTKEVVADTTAQIFWLKNRRPDLWRDKQNIEVSGELNNPYKELTTEELIKLVGGKDGS